MSWLPSLFETFRRGQTRSASLHDLGGLSAAQLADIGIPPDQIGDVVDGLLRRPHLDEIRAIGPATRAFTGPIRASSPVSCG